MSHRTARSLLPALLDQSLPARREAEVRAHVERCARCADALAELEACEALVRALPSALVPLENDAHSERRLAALARWASDQPMPWSTRFGLRAMGAFAAGLLLVLVISMGQWNPLVEARFESGLVSVAAIPATEVTPYSWR